MAPDKHSPELLLLVKSTCQKSEGPKNLPPVLPVYPWQPARSPTCWGWVGGDLVASLQPPPPWTPWRSLCCYRGHQARELLRQGEEERAKSFQILFCCSNTGKQASKQKPKPKAQQNDPTRKARVCVCVCVCPRLGAGVGVGLRERGGGGETQGGLPNFLFPAVGGGDPGCSPTGLRKGTRAAVLRVLPCPPSLRAAPPAAPSPLPGSGLRARTRRGGRGVGWAEGTGQKRVREVQRNGRDAREARRRRAAVERTNTLLPAEGNPVGRGGDEETVTQSSRVSDGGRARSPKMRFLEIEDALRRGLWTPGASR